VSCEGARVRVGCEDARMGCKGAMVGCERARMGYKGAMVGCEGARVSCEQNSVPSVSVFCNSCSLINL